MKFDCIVGFHLFGIPSSTVTLAPVPLMTFGYGVITAAQQQRNEMSNDPYIVVMQDYLTSFLQQRCNPWEVSQHDKTVPAVIMFEFHGERNTMETK